MKKCPTMLAFKQDGDCVPVFCGQWSCNHCAKRLARRWARVAAYGVRRSPDGYAYFWTLTMGRKMKTAKKAYSLIPRMWDALRKSMQRFNKQWTYIAFVEGQPKRGNMPHFHIISFETSPTSRLKDFVTRFGFGFQAKEEKIEGWQAASYVAKYSTKQNPDTPRGFRRVRVSRHWPKPPKHASEALIVKSNKERLGEYFERVARLTGVHVDKVIVNYYETLMSVHGEI